MNITVASTAGGGTSRQTRPLLHATTITVTVERRDVVRVGVSADGRVEWVEAEIDGVKRTLK